MKILQFSLVEITSFPRWVSALVLALMLVPSQIFGTGTPPPPPPPCNDPPTYGAWQLDKCPQINNTPTVSPSQLIGNVGEAPCMPTTIIPPTWDSGSKHRDITYNCPCPGCPPTETAPITITVGPVKWDTLPAKWTKPGTYPANAYVDISGGDPLCSDPPLGKYVFGSATWTVGGDWKDLGTIDISGLKDAIKKALDGVKKVSKVLPCDVKDLKLNGEIHLWRRTVYCDCDPTKTRMESKLDPAKVELTMSEIECPIPTLCLPPLKLGKLGHAAAGLYATYSGSWSIEVAAQAAQGCQNDTLCGTLSGDISAGFKAQLKACIEIPPMGAEVSGSATANIGLSLSCCNHGPGSFSVEVKPLLLKYKIEAFAVGWKKQIAKGEFNVFKGGQLDPYTFDCPI